LAAMADCRVWRYGGCQEDYEASKSAVLCTGRSVQARSTSFYGC
jgi:hypothetical protein